MHVSMLFSFFFSPPILLLGRRWANCLEGEDVSSLGERLRSSAESTNGEKIHRGCTSVFDAPRRLRLGTIYCSMLRDL